MDDDVIAGTTGTYDRIAKLYDQRAATAPPHGQWQSLRERFAAAVPPGGCVADLGCGPGRDAAWLRGLGIDTIGVDRSTGMVDLARRAGVPAVRGDLRRPPLRSASLDGVWSSAALLHVPDEETGAVLADWARLLRPGGLLFLSTALGDGARWETVSYATGGQDRRWFVYRSEKALNGALRDAGFQIQETVRHETHRTWYTVLARGRSGAPTG